MSSATAKSQTALGRVRRALRAAASRKHAAVLQRFFKTGPGEYGAGDLFLGARVPEIRRISRQTDGLSLRAVVALLRSKYHEERLLALLILVRRFKRGDAACRAGLARLYLGEARWINNWDLVDLSAPHLLGGWLLDRPRALLDRLAGSGVLWERRMAVLATLPFIRQNQFEDTLRLCRRLLGDPQDLMHKACGWMLREVGKRNADVLRGFLEAEAARMPRTMLRYAIEKLGRAQRDRWLARGRPTRLRRP